MKKSFRVWAAVVLVSLPLLAAAAGNTPEAAKQQAEQDQQTQARQQNRAQLEQQLQEAQQKLQVAAQQVARLSLQLSGPELDRREVLRLRRMEPNRAILGVTIIERNHEKPSVKGVGISAVTPDGPAEQAGLRAGDVITGINDKVFKTGTRLSPDDQLLAFMDTVKPGDALKVAYLRDGKAATVQLKAGHLDADSFAFAFDTPPVPPMPPSPPTAPTPPMPAIAPIAPRFAWFMDRDQPWGDLQLVPLTAGLGQYFGSDKGLLVVHAPQHDALKLQDGDVILSIGGREPGSPPHAMRILRSYSPGDTVKLDIMRKGKPASLNIKLPAEKRTEMGGDISELYQQFHVGPSFLHFGVE
jgi:C-terminal processing protease CtpA/Prc